MKMNSLNPQEVNLFSQQFQKELGRLHETHESHSHWSRMIMPKHKIQEIIEHLKGTTLLPPGKLKSWIESRKFRVFNKPSMGLADVLMEPTKDKLSLGEDSGPVFPRYLAIVPREDIFDTLLKIHLENNHSTLRETLHLVRGKISNIPRYLVHKFILLCPICSNNGASTNTSGMPYTPSRRCVIKARRRRKLMDQFQVDVLDLKNNPDGGYSYILHCMDHITGFHWLFPLAQIDAAEVAQNLVWGIFSLFGFPTELVSDYGKNFASEVIHQVTKLWPDELHIKNYLEGSSYKGDVTRRNTRNVTRFIDDMAEKKASDGDKRLKWSEWLPEIQFMLNATVLDVRTGKTPYEKVFRTHPVTQVPKTKFTGRNIDTSHELSPGSKNFDIIEQKQEFVTEEIVDHSDMMHHNVDNNNVVVVDMGGIEHSVPTSSVSLAHTAEFGTASSVVSNDYSFDTVHATGGTTYTIMPNADAAGNAPNTYVMESNQDCFTAAISNNSIGDVVGGDHIITTSTAAEPSNFASGVQSLQNRHGGAGSWTSATQLPYNNKLDQLRLDDAEYLDDTADDSEKWVTLSADGGQLEVAEIKPTIQEVKIAAGGNHGYRIDAVTRKATYVNKKTSPVVQKVPLRSLSEMDEGNDNKFKGFKPFSPVKSNRVIQFSSAGNSKNITRLSNAGSSPKKAKFSDTPTRSGFEPKNSYRKVRASVNVNSLSNQIVYSKGHTNTLPQQLSNNNKINLSPSYKLTSPKKIFTSSSNINVPSNTNNNNSSFIAGININAPGYINSMQGSGSVKVTPSIRTNIVSRPPQLKIPVSRKTAVPSKTNLATTTPIQTGGKRMKYSTHYTSDDDDYGVLSDEEESNDGSDDDDEGSSSEQDNQVL